MGQSRLIRGALILQVAVLLSRVLGLVFIIPFTALVKDSGMALYAYAYNPYTVILSISTLGVPLAVSKFVSKYNAIGDYHTGRRLFKSGLVFMTLTGFVAFLVLFYLAPMLASGVVDQNPESGGNSKGDIVFVIRMVSTALIIVPAMSLMRGYFQGFQSMGPTGVSQVVEQLVRIMFILIGAFLVIVVFEGTVTTAVALATFAAFVGALAGLFILIRYWYKRKPHLDKLVADNRGHERVSLRKMYKELITYAVPFVIVGLAIPLYQLIDQLMLNTTLMNQLDYTQTKAEKIFAILNQMVHKLLMIPVSLSTALAITIVPTITNSFASNKLRELQTQLTQAFQLVLFLTIPAAAGLSVLSYSVFGALYPMENVEIGGLILRWYAPTALLLALFTVTAAILQGINQQRFAVFSLLVGVLLKLLLNEFFIVHFEAIGPVLATNIGFLSSVLINIFVIRAYSGYNFKLVGKRGLLICIFTVVMAVVVNAATLLIGGGIPEDKWQAVWRMVVGVLAGGACFAFLSIRSNLAAKVLGSRFPFLKKKDKTKAESR